MSICRAKGLNKAPSAILCKFTELRCSPYAAWLGSLEVKLLDKEIQSPHLSKKYGKVVPELN